MKPVRFTAHALTNQPKRGFTNKEVKEVIETEQWKSAEFNKLECSKNFNFNSE